MIAIVKFLIAPLHGYACCNNGTDAGSAHAINLQARFAQDVEPWLGAADDGEVAADPDDVPALTEYADKLARKRARSERAG